MTNLDLAREFLKENPDMTVGDAVYIKTFAMWLDQRTPEPGAVSPDQSLRGMAVYADEVPPIPAPELTVPLKVYNALKADRDDWRERASKTYYHQLENRMTTAENALAFLKRCGKGDCRIVCTGDLTELQIAESRLENRMWVNDDGIGFVLLPWDLSTPKDKDRERRLAK